MVDMVDMVIETNHLNQESRHTEVSMALINVKNGTHG